MAKESDIESRTIKEACVIDPSEYQRAGSER